MRLQFLRKLMLFFVVLTGLPVAIYLLSQRTSFFGRAAGEPANLIINTASITPRNYSSWRNLAQGGEEKTRMLEIVAPRVRALKPEYVRIDHVYDFYDVVGRNPDGSLTFNWQKLDLTLSDIATMGAKPFISLSYMPSAMSRGTEVDAPNNWSEWETLVQKTIEHISGEKRIAGVYYEVWNEPDLFGGWKMYGNKNYLDLYSHSVAGANRATGVASFKIGGPATTALYENWLRDFLEFAANNNLRLDFYSWHRYSMNLDDFEKDLFLAQTLRAEAPARFSDLELVISEMGHDPKNHAGYDNSFGAIHTLGAIASVDESLGRGFSFEIKDGPGPEKLWGRWGMMTHEKFGEPQEKDRYRALAFLNQMEGERLKVSGQGSWVKAFGSSTVNGILKLLVVNYDARGAHGETVPITYLNLPDGEYNLVRTDFLGGKRSRAVETTGGIILATEYFSPNSAALIELIPR